MIVCIIFFSILFASYCFYSLKISNKPFLWQYAAIAAILLIILSASYAGFVYSAGYDHQILSGKVINKHNEMIPCQHAYPCNCHSTGYGKNKSTTCDTCHLHPFDREWIVETTVGPYNISTVDSQGLIEPQKYKIAKYNDPVAKVVAYFNYLKASDNNLYGGNENLKISYPSDVHDYYELNRVVLDNVKISKQDVDMLSDYISNSLKDVAKIKQVNVVLVITSNADSDFAEKLKNQWFNGKKNDLVVVVSTQNYPNIDWASVFGWSSDDMVNVHTRDDLKDYGKIDTHAIDIIMMNINQYWQRKPLHEYKYLMANVEPKLWQDVVIFFAGLLGLIGLEYARQNMFPSYRFNH